MDILLQFLGGVFIIVFVVLGIAHLGLGTKYNDGESVILSMVYFGLAWFCYILYFTIL